MLCILVHASTLLSAINELQYDHSYSLQVPSSCTSALSIAGHETFWPGSAMPEGLILHTVWRTHWTPHRGQSLIQKWHQWWRTGRNAQSEGKAQMLQSTARLQNEWEQGMIFIMLLYIIYKHDIYIACIYYIQAWYSYCFYIFYIVALHRYVKHQTPIKCSIRPDLHEIWNIW